MEAKTKVSPASVVWGAPQAEREPNPVLTSGRRHACGLPALALQNRCAASSYLRHRGVDIGMYQKSAQSRGQQCKAESAVARVGTITPRLAVENNSKFVRGRKRAMENIERYCLEPYGMKRLETGHYELAIPYRSDDELDKSVHDLLTEISQEAEMRNCFIEANAREKGTERRW